MLSLHVWFKRLIETSAFSKRLYEERKSFHIFFRVNKQNKGIRKKVDKAVKNTLTGRLQKNMLSLSKKVQLLSFREKNLMIDCMNFAKISKIGKNICCNDYKK